MIGDVALIFLNSRIKLAYDPGARPRRTDRTFYHMPNSVKGNCLLSGPRPGLGPGRGPGPGLSWFRTQPSPSLGRGPGPGLRGDDS